MRVVLANGTSFELGDTEATPTIGITDYSRRVTDDYGVTTVVERAFSRRMSVKLALPFDGVSTLQQRLANLRASSALWVADEQIAWLSVRGFYKEFDLDHAVPPLSYCTLTVEGLAEAATISDSGLDPAVNGTSTLLLLQPVTISDANLVSSNVPENDAAEWSEQTNYPSGARVIRAATHRVFESAIAGNVGNDPAGASGKWIDVGPTKRWAMFDQALGTATTAASAVAVTIDAPVIHAVALLDVSATSVRVQATGYDRTIAAAAGAITFLDLPAGITRVTVTTTGSSVAIGTLMVGKLVGLGTTEASPTAGITDYSRKDVDDFGAVTIVERAWSKRMTAKALIRTDAVDVVANRIATVRAQPSLWIGQTGLDSLIVYGFFKDFSIEVDANVSKLSLTIEGLSKAAPIARAPIVLVPRGQYDPTQYYGEGDVVQYDGSTWQYINAAASAGNTPPSLPATENAFWRAFATAGVDGRDGTNGRDGLNGTDGAPGGRGADGRTSYVHYAYANSLDGRIDFDLNQPNGRAYEGSYTDFTATDSSDPAAYTWREYKGPPFGMAVRGPAVIAGNSVIKRPDSADAWDADAYSTIGLRNGVVVTFQFGAPSYAMAGLNTDPTTDSSWDSLDFAWYCDGNTARIYESGAQVAIAFEGISPDYIFRIEYDGRYVRYFVNDNGPYRTVDVGPGKLFYFDSSLRYPLSKIFNIGFMGNGTAGVDGVPGIRGDDGLPGAPGANGVSSYTAYAYANSPDGSVDFTTGEPGMRGYIGVSANLTSASEPTSPGAYTWSLYRGPPFGVGTRGRAVIVGTTVLKSDAAGGWDSDAFSTSSYTGAASVAFRLTGGGAAMGGLNTDPLTDASYGTLDYAFYREGSALYAFESSANALAFGGCDDNTRLRIDYNGATVTYFINDVPRRQVRVSSGLAYYFDSSFNFGCRIEDLTFSGGSQIAPAVTLIADTPTTYVGAAEIRGMPPEGGWGTVHAHSVESFTLGAVAQWTIPAGSSAQNAMIGLGQAQHNGDSYQGITFSIFQQSDGYVDGRVNGNSWVVGPAVNTAVDNNYKLHFDGETIRYFVNGVQFGTYPWGRQPDPLYFVAAMASGNPRATNITFTAAGTVGTDGRDGLNGNNGAPGAPGANGQSSYLHIAYANSPDGYADFTTGAPGGRLYLGTLVDQTVADSGNPAAYRWSLVKGADGLNGQNGTPGANGANGQPTYVHIAYANSADGGQDFSVDNPAGRTYVGFYVDQTVADSGNPAVYSWSLVKGADGTSPFIATVSTTQMTVNATASGATKSDALPKSATLRVKQGATDVTAAASVTLTASPSNLLSMSYANGVLSLNQANGEGYIDVRVSVGAVLVDTIRIAVRRILDSPPAGASSSFESTITTSTYDARVTPTMTVSADLNGQLRGEMYVDYDVAAGNGNFNVTLAAKMQYRVANGSGGSDMAAEAVGSTAYKSGTPTGPVNPDDPPPPDPISGSVSFAVTVGGLIAGQNYEVWGLLRRYAGNASARGTGTVTGRKP